MTLSQYFQVLKSWLLPAGLVLGLLCAAAFTWLSTPMYAANTTLFISAQGLQNDASRAYQGNLLSTGKVKTYTELIMSDRIRVQVSARLRTEIAAGQITATAQPDTVLITTTVTDASPYRAQQIADAVGEEFVALVTQLEKPVDNAGAPPAVVARMLQPAQLPIQQISPRPAWNLAVGGVLGLLLGYALTSLRHVLHTPPPAEQPAQANGSSISSAVLGTFAHDPMNSTLHNRHRAVAPTADTTETPVHGDLGGG